MGVCVLGSINLDIVCAVDELPAPGETISARAVNRYPGGKGLNQAVAAARWGAATAMIGAVGADEAGVELRAVLDEAGVDTVAIATLADAPTGHGYIFVSAAAENMIVVAGGANLGVTPGLVAAAPGAKGGVWLAQLETPLPSVRAFFTQLGADEAVKMLNAAPAVAGGETLFPLVDILIVNETELARYAGAAEPPSHIDEVAALARGMISRAGQTVVVTLGAAGAAAVGDKGVVTAAGRPARAVDTTGAGDCFCGVLAAALSEGAALGDAMARANAAAALSTQAHGAAVSMPSREATESFREGLP